MFFDEMLCSLLQEIEQIEDTKAKALKTKDCESRFRSQFPRVMTRCFAVILCECLDQIWDNDQVNYDDWLQSNFPEIVITSC